MSPRGPVVTRRIFLASAAAVLAAGALPGCGANGSAPSATVVDQTVAYKLSGRGRRVSRAAKSNNANKLFATATAAANGKAHPGDTSQVVMIDVSPQRWFQLFGGGNLVADLRKI